MLSCAIVKHAALALLCLFGCALPQGETTKTEDFVEFDSPPVLLGHDLGALLALQVAHDARAVVALSPLVTTPIAAEPSRALRSAETFLSRTLQRPLLAAPGAWGWRWVAGVVENSSACDEGGHLNRIIASQFTRRPTMAVKKKATKAKAKKKKAPAKKKKAPAKKKKASTKKKK